VFVWMVICFISILAHELGHALTGIKYGGGKTWIKLWAMGGLAYNQGGRFTRNTRALMILAGPGAGFCIFLLTVAFMHIKWPDGVGLEILWKTMILNQSWVEVSAAGRAAARADLTLVRILETIVRINLWWSIINLLPIHPLDGGQFAECFMRSRKKLHKIGMITGGCMVLFGIATQHYFIAVLFGFLAYQNYQQHEQAPY
ncbi:MAG: metalloprotease, partial [Akkermansiaceae bacterium]